MQFEILLALILKAVEDKLSNWATDNNILSSRRGPRGFTGKPGLDFSLEDHEETLKRYAKDYSLKFSDLSEEDIIKLKGEKGDQGEIGFPGKDGSNFNLEDHKENIKIWIKDAAIKFSDLSVEEIESLRGPVGPRGFKGKDGLDGKDFIFEDHRKEIEDFTAECVLGLADSLKLKFTDLSEEERFSLRGPRGQRGKQGKDFIFEDHIEFFKSLKFKFSDFTTEELESLKLKFKDLSSEDLEQLKLKFTDLNHEDLMKIRGPRGPRGQKGQQGLQGPEGKKGDKGETIRGPIGPIGLSGRNGTDGLDGKDAPTIVDIKVEKTLTSFYLVFIFSDGSILNTPKIPLPKAVDSSSTVVIPFASGTIESIESSKILPTVGTIPANEFKYVDTMPYSNFFSVRYFVALQSETGKTSSFDYSISNNGSGGVNEIVFGKIWGGLNHDISAFVDSGSVKFKIVNNESSIMTFKLQKLGF